MPRYKVDVKAFISVDVEAPDEDAAREAANRYVEDGLSPTAEETVAWTEACREQGETAVATDASGGFAVDGTSEVEPA